MDASLCQPGEITTITLSRGVIPGSRSVCHAWPRRVVVDKSVRLPIYPRSLCHGSYDQFVTGDEWKLAITLSRPPIVLEPIASPIATGVACGRPKRTAHWLKRRPTKTVVVNDV